MKKFLRWLIIIIVAVIALIIAAFLSIDTVVRKLAEKRIREETGMTATIGNLHIGFSDQSLTVHDFKLLNPPEFGGGSLMNLAELHVEYDLEAMRSNIIHFRVLKVDLAELNVVEKKDGTSNIDVLARKPAKRPQTAPRHPTSTNAPPRTQTFGYQFGGIDKLQVSLGEANYTSERFPERNRQANVGLTNEVFKDIKTEQDLQTVGIVLILKSGFSNFLQGKLF